MNNIDEIVGEAKSIGIAGHVRPDGDCIGSCLSIYNYLAKTRPELSVTAYLELVDDEYMIIDNADKIVTSGFDGTVYDLFIAVDTSSIDRLGENIAFFKNAKRTVCVDHHASNTGFADTNIVEADATSACEVIYGLLNPKCIDSSVAKALYMGIAHDSGVFRFQSTTPHTMRIAADLMECGIDANKILEETYYGQSYRQMIMTANIQRLTKLDFDGKFLYGYCTNEMRNEFGVTISELDCVIDQIRNVKGVEVTMFTYQLDNGQFKVSLRSKNYVDVREIAVSFGGGGHVHAAGFELSMPLDKAIEIVKEKIAEVI